MTLQNFSSELDPALLKLASKTQVRECDELQPGRFVAYVDERSETYDVELTIENGGGITGHKCDCKITKPFCQHKVALMQFLSGKKKSKPVKASAKKKGECLRSIG